MCTRRQATTTRPQHMDSDLCLLLCLTTRTHSYGITARRDFHSFRPCRRCDCEKAQFSYTNSDRARIAGLLAALLLFQFFFIAHRILSVRATAKRYAARYIASLDWIRVRVLLRPTRCRACYPSSARLRDRGLTPRLQSQFARQPKPSRGLSVCRPCSHDAPVSGAFVSGIETTKYSAYCTAHARHICAT